MVTGCLGSRSTSNSVARRSLVAPLLRRMVTLYNTSLLSAAWPRTSLPQNLPNRAGVASLRTDGVGSRRLLCTTLIKAVQRGGAASSVCDYSERPGSLVEALGLL